MASVSPHSKPESKSTWHTIKKKSSYCQYSFLRSVPIVNMLYDLLFDEIPSPENIKDILNLVGLVDALMLSIIITFLTAIE